jgi:hypothetical protein
MTAWLLAERVPPDPLSASFAFASVAVAAVSEATARAMAQMKPASSRATAVMATTSGLPARQSAR